MYGRPFTSWYILLVGEDEQQSLFHLPVEDDPVEFLPRFVDSGAVVGVDDEDQALRACTNSESASAPHS